jgi:4-amino-4-deoxy-L-arabinose transferase-like glycosyltransferase
MPVKMDEDGMMLSNKIARTDILHKRPTDWLAFCALLLGAFIVRQIFFIGPAGSDDAVYLGAALKIANGDWSVISHYNGSLRFGFHIPMALFLSIFGTSDYSANGFSILCSMLEILCVYLMAFHAFGRSTGLLAAILLAFTPLHMVVSTSVHADPVAALALTASIVIFYFAEQARRPYLFLATGIAIGYVFWVKELIIFYTLMFPIYMAVLRKWDPMWLYIVVGGMLMLVAHLAYMWLNAGDPLYLFKVMKMQVADHFIGVGKKESSPYFYIRYLLFSVYWTFFIGWFALAAMAYYMYKRTRGQADDAIWFVIWWFLSLLLLFTFLPVSLSPFQFVTKQANYINLFLAPMAILSAWLIARLPNYMAVVMASGAIVGGSFLLMLYQATIRADIAGSEQIHLFALKHPEYTIYATNSARAVSLYRQHQKRQARLTNIIDLRDLPLRRVEQNKQYLIVVDLKTLTRLPSDFDSIANTHVLPGCWKRVQQLMPAPQGWGVTFARALVPFVPAALRPSLLERFEAPPVTLYAFDPLRPWCHA